MSDPLTYANREDQARAEIGETEISDRLARIIVMVFLVLIFSVPVIQIGVSFCNNGEVSREFLTGFDGTITDMKNAADKKDGPIASLLAANDVLNKRIHQSETSLDDNLFLSQLMLPKVQALMCRLGVGNEKAYVGQQGWLFYEPGVVSITGPAFLDPAQLKARSRSGKQADPVLAIMDTRDQLKAMGIELIVLPVPVKPSVQPGQFTDSNRVIGKAVHNRSWQKFLERLAEADVLVYDPTKLLLGSGEYGSYLSTDTHWTPESMQWVARDLASWVRVDTSGDRVQEPVYRRIPQVVTNLGDIGVMLKLPEDQELFPKETVTIQKVERVDGKPLFEEEGAEILLLGDSFSNIYSLEDMGWGRGAGFAEQLRVELNQPVDAIVRNDEGSRATRKLLSHSLKRGEPRLAGKKVVIWQFAARELALGNWELIDFPHVDVSVQPDPVRPAPSAKGTRVKGTVIAISGRPEKGAVYKNFIMKLHVDNMTKGDGRAYDDGEGVVHVLAMKDKQILPIARVKAGDEIDLVVKPWDDVRSRYETMKAGVLEDEEVELLSELYWGDVP